MGNREPHGYLDAALIARLRFNILLSIIYYKLSITVSTLNYHVIYFLSTCLASHSPCPMDFYALPIPGRLPTQDIAIDGHFMHSCECLARVCLCASRACN